MAEEKCEKKTLEEFKDLLDLIDDFLLLYTNILATNTTTLLDKHNESRGNIAMVNLKNIRSFRSLQFLLKKGFYIEYCSILRSCYENLHLSEYFIKNPEIAKKWIDQKHPIRRSVIMKDLKISKEVDQLYAVLCEYTHPNIGGIVGLLDESQEDVEYKVLPFFDRKEAFELLNIQLLILFPCVKHLYEYTKRYEKFEPDFEDEAEKLFLIGTAVLGEQFGQVRKESAD